MDSPMSNSTGTDIVVVGSINADLTAKFNATLNLEKPSWVAAAQ